MRIFLKLGFFVTLATVASSIGPVSVIAGVVNSNHDLSFKTLGSLKAGACSHCHIPHKAGGDKLWANVLSDSGTAWGTETVSKLCYTCHGGGIPNYALEQNPFGDTNKHQRTVATLEGWSDITAGTISVANGFELSGDGNLKCTSCHNVHDNTKRPFLRFDTSGAGLFNLGLNCLKCHPNRNWNGGRGTANLTLGVSQHPTSVALPSNSTNPVPYVDSYFVPAQAEFNIVGGTQTPGVAAAAGWNLGGHRNDNLPGGVLSCVTCHAVHGNETAVWTAADGANAVAAAQTGFNHLTVREGNPTTAAPYVAPLCTGCHNNNPTGGPGRIGTFTHPIGVNRTGLIFQIPAANGYKWGGANDILVCQSCHKIHYGAPNTSLLFGTIDAPANSNKNCAQCHTFGAVAHHPNGPTVVAPPGMASTTRSTGPINWSNLARGSQSSTYFWGSGSTILCSTCHNQGGAHNNPDVFNSLVAYNVNSEMCVDCHTNNPSQYTTVVGGHPGSLSVTLDASHYIGNIMTPSYKRTLAWLTTGLSSKYGTTGGGLGPEGALICQSCHTLKMTGNLPGPTFSNNGVGSLGRVRPSVGLLLETAGNLNPVFGTGITSSAADLCTGCHGASPQGGQAQAGTKIHPAISSTPPMTAIANSTLSDKLDGEWAARGTVSKNVDGLLNCESCHRPHDAANGSGALILEGIGTASTKTAGGGFNVRFDRATSNSGANYAEEATFCNLCHTY